MRQRALTLGCIALAACGTSLATQEAGVQEDASGDGEPTWPVPDASYDRALDLDSQLQERVDHWASYDLVDGGGDGPECRWHNSVIQSCCNGLACEGFCVRVGDGAVGCSCWGIAGGCAEMPGSVCCNYPSQGCVYAPYCTGN